MTSLKKFVLILLVGVSFAACDRPECQTTNSVFNSFSSDKQEYKKELAHQLNEISADNLRFWLKDFKRISAKEILVFYVQGEGLCAEMELEVKDWTGMENLREQQGESYRGAEFKNLRYLIQKDNEDISFVLNGFTHIID